MAVDETPRAINPVWLRQQLADSFTLEELRTLTFDLGINYDNLEGAGLDSKARELVIYCRNRAMLDQLVKAAEVMRPNVAWSPEPDQREGETKEAAQPTPAQRLYKLVKAFNRNRHRPISDARTRTGDDLAFQMREMAPELEGQFDVSAWLHSPNMGKRVAAIEFLDWHQDVEYLEPLLDMLPTEQPFVQFHILIALNSLLEQLNFEEMQFLRDRLASYDPRGDGSRRIWSEGLRRQVDQWFAEVGSPGEPQLPAKRPRPL